MTTVPLWTRTELTELFQCKLPDDFSGTGISIDTRTLKKGDIFIAISGDNHNGNAFAKIADEKGASLVILSQPVAGLRCPSIVVDDTLDAMRILGRSARLRSKATIIGITGSVGKTSTKEILRHVLSFFGKVSCAEASYNNHWGVPLSLSRLPREADFAIFEMGMNNSGEIAVLSEMVRPNVAIVTNIAPAHIGNMGSLKAIADEKSTIFEGLEPEGIAIIPVDPDFLSFFKNVAQKKFPQQIISFGDEQPTDVLLYGFSQNEAQPATAKVAIGEQRYTFTSPLVGRHLAVNSLIAFAIGKALRLDMSKIKHAFETMPVLKGRCHVHHLLMNNKAITLIDDSFNANLSSMIAGINTLISIKPKDKGRRLAVLGEMLELGSFAIEHHGKISELCENDDISQVFLCGSNVIKQAFSTLPQAKISACVNQSKELVPLIINALQDNDVILVKGSKGSKVSLITEALLKASKK